MRLLDGKIEVIFLMIAFVWGLITIFIVPPFQAPDENVHYLRAAGISEGSHICKGDTLKVSTQYSDFVENMDVSRIAHHPNEKFSFDLLLKQQPSNNTGTTMVDMPLCYSLSLYHFIPAFFIFIGKLLNLELLHSFYLCRIASLLLAVILTTLSIKTAPFGKYLIFALSLLPMTIYQYSSVSYDALLIPIIFLSISYTLSLYYKDSSLNLKEFSYLLVLYSLVSIIKPGYNFLLFIPLILFLRNYSTIKYSEIRRLFGFFSLLLLFNITLLYMQRLFLGTTVFAGRPTGQLGYILTHPLTFPLALIVTISHKIGVYLLGFIGILGWFDYPLSLWTYLLIITGFLVFINLEGIHFKLPTRVRLIIVICSGLSSLAIFLAMYLLDTPIGNLLITGVQGRYFIGLALPLGLSLFSYTSKFSLLLRKHKGTMFSVLALALLFIIAGTIFTTFKRYYF